MNGTDLLIGLGHVSEVFIDEAETEKWKHKIKIVKLAIPMAASLVLMIVSLALYKSISITNPIADILPPVISKSGESTNFTAHYNLKLNNAAMASASRIAIKGHFWYELTAEQAKKVLPDIARSYAIEGKVHYSSAEGKADLYEIVATIAVNETISGKIIISPNEIVNDYTIVGEPMVSQIEGVPIEAGLFVTDKNSMDEQNYIYYAAFKMENAFYYMEFTSKNEKAEAAFTGVVAAVVLGGKADFSIFDHPVIPDIIEKSLTESEAYSEADFGQYLIKVPGGYAFNSANRLLNQNSNVLIASWSKGYEDVRVQISRLDENSKARIVSHEDTTLFDMSLYSIPWADSIPREKYPIIENPVFRIEDLTLDMIKLRGYTHNEAGDPGSSNLRLRFSVLYDDVVVEVHSEGLSPEYLFEQLTGLTL